MKRIEAVEARTFITATLVALIAASCNWLPEKENEKEPEGDFATISVNFTGTKGPEEFNKDNFILSIVRASGDTCWYGRFGDRPEKLEVAVGDYVIRAVSDDTPMPAYDTPVYGAEACVTVSKGENADVNLLCKLINCGLQLSYSDKFVEKFGSAEGALVSVNGTLECQCPNETGRIAYFNSGTVYYTVNGEYMFSKDLISGQILHLTVDAEQSDGQVSISITVDESVEAVEESTYAGISPVLSVRQSKKIPEGITVTVYGRIEGCIKNSKFYRSGELSTNIVIADNPEDSDMSQILPVELKSTALKEALSLTDNDLIGSYITVKGITKKIYGTTSLGDVTYYKVEE